MPACEAGSEFLSTLAYITPDNVHHDVTSSEWLTVSSSAYNHYFFELRLVDIHNVRFRVDEEGTGEETDVVKFMVEI